MAQSNPIEVRPTNADRSRHFVHDDDNQGREKRVYREYRKFFSEIESRSRISPSSLMLFLLFQIRRKIKNEIINSALLKKLIEELPVVLLEYYSIFLELIDAFLRAKNDSLVKFATTALK